jgi:hypothetical protein
MTHLPTLVDPKTKPSVNIVRRQAKILKRIQNSDDKTEKIWKPDPIYNE